MTLREAAQQALVALKIPPEGRDLNQQALACYRAEAILRAALAEPEPVQEPYAWMAVGGSIWRHKGSEDDVPLYTHPAPRQPLTRDQIRKVFLAHGFVIKDGQTDLKPYVYAAAEALIAMVHPAPQRQPLTDEEIIEHFKAQVDTGSMLSFADGVRFAERAHGIGGEA